MFFFKFGYQITESKIVASISIKYVVFLNCVLVQLKRNYKNLNLLQYLFTWLKTMKIIAFICLFNLLILKTNCFHQLSDDLTEQLNDFELQLRNNLFFRPKTMEKPIEFLGESINRHLPPFDFKMRRINKGRQIHHRQGHHRLSKLGDNLYNPNHNHRKDRGNDSIDNRIDNHIDNRIDNRMDNRIDNRKNVKMYRSLADKTIKGKLIYRF